MGSHTDAGCRYDSSGAACTYACMIAVEGVNAYCKARPHWYAMRAWNYLALARYAWLQNWYGS